MSASRTIASLLLFAPLVLLAAAPVYADQGSATAPATLSVRASPPTVAIDLNYGGSRVELDGVRPEGAHIALTVASPDTATHVSKKGKVFGFVWMTTERVTIDHLPTLYVISSSAPLEELLPAADLAQLGLDPSFAALLKRASVARDGYDGGSLSGLPAREYVLGLRDIRIGQSLYAVHEGEVALHGTDWTTSVALPAEAPPGKYEVTAYAIVDQKVVGQATGSFSVEKTGMVSLLGTMARDNASAYGTLAIVAVVGIGLGVGRLLGGGGH